MITNDSYTNREGHSNLSQENELAFQPAPLLLAPPQNMTEVALHYAKNGFSVIPTGHDKRPALHSWTPYRTTIAGPGEIQKWWSHDSRSIAVVCGAVSGHLEVIDFDEKYNLEPERIFDRWKALVEIERPGLVDRLVAQKTQNGGEHVLYRCTTIEGNQKLAMRDASEEEKRKEPKAKSITLIETRGEGGFVLCYPSTGYGLINGSFDNISVISAEDRAILIRCARELNRFIDPQHVVRSKQRKGDNRPGDKYNQTANHHELLEKHGWTFVAETNDIERWRRPGKTEGTSASFLKQAGLFRVFSSNAPVLEPNNYYDKFALFTYLEANGDFTKAASLVSGSGQSDDPSINIRAYLNSRYDIRFNIVNHRIEIKKKEQTEFRQLEDYELNSLFFEQLQEGFQMPADYFARLLYSDFVEKVDPIKVYFDQLPTWDQTTDHIKRLASTVTLAEKGQQERFITCLTRWLTAYVGCAIDEPTINQTAIIFVGAQGIGKSRWLNKLIPEALSKYKFIGTINPDSKDSEMFLSECLLINLDELETLRKSETGALKTIMTKASIKVRLPYHRLPMDLVRRASFVGSINQDEFLTDPTGSRRFLAFETTAFDIDGMPNMDLVLAQALFLYRSGGPWWFDDKEIEDINRHNREFAVTSYEEELLLASVVKATDLDEAGVRWLSATEIAELIKNTKDTGIDRLRIDDRFVQKLGAALVKNKFTFKRLKGRKVYAVK